MVSSAKEKGANRKTLMIDVMLATGLVWLSFQAGGEGPGKVG